MANSTVSGAPARPTTPAGAGLAVSNPANSSANEPPLIARPMAMTLPSETGTGRSRGARAMSTIIDRAIA